MSKIPAFRGLRQRDMNLVTSQKPMERTHLEKENKAGQNKIRNKILKEEENILKKNYKNNKMLYVNISTY
jgi:hypothetical protein